MPLVESEAYMISSLANGFSYWQAQDISNATATYFDDMAQAVGHIQQVAGSIDAVHVMTGETGWPTGKAPRSTPPKYILTPSRRWHKLRIRHCRYR